ncbi:hypothetical protein FHS29_000492 [Saccharothrix tamanrassetensis]|uniref:Uncharacterized protein n=1 Tax=Saccharothrix tamanrassetensis TaxID=1051531 RepID=A0A841C5V8_9PSEU|nr:hypothetical protein [Saccharothrix tamanrassetensis]MBB5953922.1 hypothetical protein [Saccharothrix tamanrassetensis]
MRVVFQGEAWVHYGQLSVESDVESGEMGACFGGQRNGLCGGAVPGTLFLMTGTHTGEVGFTVEVHDTAPEIGAEWEDVVEVSFRPVGDSALVGWAGEWSEPLELVELDYRVRYSGLGMDREQQGLDEDPALERYLLQFWPAPPAEDEIVRQTSRSAAYWHEFARKQPPPPTPEEKAEALRIAEAERKRAAEAASLAAELEAWGGNLPDERLRRLRGPALQLARFDRPLVNALAAVPDRTQRDIARWAARRACAEARLGDVPWIAAALDAMDRGDRPFDDDRTPWDRLFSDPSVPQTLITTPDGRTDNFLQQAMAFPVLFSVVHEDPLEAAVDVVHTAAATMGYGRQHELFAELRRTFPRLA